MVVEVAPQRDAPPPRVPPLNLGEQATKRAPLDLLAYKTQKHWDDCIKRLHMIQDEERRRLLRHADNKIQAKRAEWLGGPAQTDASLHLSERRGGWQTDRPGRTRSAHSIDTLVTPRGPSMDRLLQAARDPRGWMSNESASGPARGQALPATCARKSRRIAAKASAPSDTDDDDEKMDMVELKKLQQKKEAEAQRSLPTLVPCALRELRTVNSEIKKDMARLVVLENNDPATDRAVHLADARDKLREARSALRQVNRCVHCLRHDAASSAAGHASSAVGLGPLRQARNFVLANKVEGVNHRRPAKMLDRLLTQAIATEARMRGAAETRTEQKLDEWQKLSDRRVQRHGTLVLPSAASVRLDIRESAEVERARQTQQMWLSAMHVHRVMDALFELRKRRRCNAMLEMIAARSIQRLARAKFKWDIKRKAKRVIKLFLNKTVVRWRWKRLRDDCVALLRKFLLDVKRSRGICHHVHFFRLRVIKIQRAIRQCLAFTRTTLREHLVALEASERTLIVKLLRQVSVRLLCVCNINLCAYANGPSSSRCCGRTTSFSTTNPTRRRPPSNRPNPPTSRPFAWTAASRS